MRKASVVVGIDDSPGALPALDWAAEEAQRRRAPLQVVYARPLLPHLLPAGTGQPPGHGPRLLSSAESRLARSRPGLDVRCLEVVDTPEAALVAASEVAELLVVGSRGDGVPGMPPGSVGLHAATRAYSPVVVVRGRAHPPAARHRREVVLGVDARAPGEAAIDFAFAAAERRGALVRVVHAWQPPSVFATVALSGEERSSREDTERELLWEAVRIARKQHPDVPTVPEVVPLGAVEALVGLCRQAELVVIGRREPTTPYHPRLGPVAYGVLRQAAVPVAVVPDHRPAV
jgi:nucleotide-binding universal stress UspA family protein